MIGQLSPTDLLVLVITIFLFLAILTAGFALLFYYLSERSHRFDVNIMHNLTQLHNILKQENAQLRAENLFLKGSKNITKDIPGPSNEHEIFEDQFSGIPSPNPSIGELNR